MLGQRILFACLNYRILMNFLKDATYGAIIPKFENLMLLFREAVLHVFAKSLVLHPDRNYTSALHGSCQCKAKF